MANVYQLISRTVDSLATDASVEYGMLFGSQPVHGAVNGPFTVRCSHDLTLTDLMVTLPVAPGSGKTMTIKVYIAGSAAITMTISNFDTYTTWSGSQSISQGDEIYITYEMTSGSTDPGGICWAYIIDTAGGIPVVFSQHLNTTASRNYVMGCRSNAGTSADNQTMCPVPVAGTFRNLYVRVNTTFTGSITVISRIGSASATTASDGALTVAGITATTAEDTTHTDPVTAGQQYTLRTSKSGGGALNDTVSCCVEFLPDTDGESFICGTTLTDEGTASATRYISLVDKMGDDYSSTESAKQTPVFACTASDLYVRSSAAPGGSQTIDCTIRNNASNTSITTQLTTAVNNSDTSHTASLSDFDLIDMAVALSATPAANSSRLTWGLKLVLDTGNDLISGALSGATTLSGSLGGTGTLTGSLAGATTLTGTISGGTSSITGALAGATTLTGTLSAKGTLTGNLAGTTTLTGRTVSLTGALTGSTVLVGNITGIGSLSGNLTGITTLTGSLAGPGALSGSINGSTSLSGTLLGTGTLSGPLSGSTTLSGAIRSRQSISGNLSGATTLTGNLGGIGTLSSALAGSTTLTGTIKSLRGSLAGSTTLDGVLTGTGTLTGNIAGSTTLSGTMSNTQTGQISGSTTLTGTLTATGSLAGAITSTTTLQANIYGKGNRTGSIGGSTVITGSLSGTGSLGGSYSGSTTLLGSGTLKRLASGSLTGSTTLTSNLTGHWYISGSLTGETVIVGTISYTFTSTGNVSPLKYTAVADKVKTFPVADKLVRAPVADRIYRFPPADPI